MSPDVDLSLGAEWAALELLCKGEGSPAERQLLGAWLSSPELDWGELLSQALRHQMLPMLGHATLESEARKSIPFYLLHHLTGELELNRWRLALYRRRAVELVAALEEARVPVVATKGITFESTIYQALGTRMLKDVDFMIRPRDRDAAAEILSGLGYEPGVYDWARGEIIPHRRRDQMRYLLHPDHLPRQVRLLEEHCVPYVYVDVANSLTWSKSEYQVPVEEALASAVRQPVPGLPDATLPCFGPGYQFLFTVLHLFREAWLVNWMEYGIDVSLMKFGDVIRLFRRHREELTDGSLESLLRRHQVTEPVLWVLEHLDRTFGTDTVAALGLEGEVEDSWLAAAHPDRGRERTWTGDMRQRLHHRERRELFREEGS